MNRTQTSNEAPSHSSSSLEESCESCPRTRPLRCGHTIRLALVLLRRGLGAVVVVSGLDGLVVLGDGAFPLPERVVRIAAEDVRPHLGPLGFEVAVECHREGVDRLLRI